MKFQKLTIHNIASIEDAVIDFEAQPLVDSEVFLITGKTGAGKSTILDAICLALYADTPRLYSTKMQGITMDAGKEVKIDDPCQLMRRNTIEACVVLTFIGSNGVNYEATWAVARAHKKISGSIKKKTWELKNLDTNVTLTKNAEIKNEIRVAVGLDFNQFCRTTMLAQGEFTRFLNSKDDDKAEILEKITGVDIYSKIGAKVYELTDHKKKEWEDAKRIVEGTRTLTDTEIAEKQEALSALDNQYKEFKEGGDKDVAKRDWLSKDGELNESKNNAAETLRIANEVVESDDFKHKEQAVKDWKATIDARLWMSEAQKAQRMIESETALLSEFKAELSKLIGNFNLEEQEGQIKKLEAEVEAFQLPNLRKEFTQAKVELVKIGSVKELVASLLKEVKRRETNLISLQRQHLALEAKRQKAAEMTVPLNKAKELMDLYQSMLEKQKDTIHKFAKSLRLKLHKGDICPVCRQEIVHDLPHEEDLQSMLKPLEEDFNQAEKNYNKLYTENVRINAEILAESTAYTKEKQTFDNDKTIEELQNKAQQECAPLGIDLINKEAIHKLSELEQHTIIASNDLDSRIKAAEAIEKKVSVLRKELDNKRADIAKLSEKITVTTTKLKTAEESQNTNQTKLNAFLAEHPELNMERLETLNTYTSNYITREDDSLKAAREAVVAKRTLFDNAEKLIAEHQTKKPELTEDDTLEALNERIEGIEKQLAEIGEKKGAINQELKTDRENRERLGALIQEADDRKAVYQKWSRLNQLIGNATGSTFRKIAQSYVLTSLIHSANSYMKTLTDRYTLKVTPGTFVISLEDAYQGFVSRAASTISGGESFLVSLSLALALSDIGQQWQVDTLFIDEGFGTLSGEPLQKAVETLRSLHSKTGRHVGIISHVEELQERIPVQIQVNQEGHNSSSKVKIVPERNTFS